MAILIIWRNWWLKDNPCQDTKEGEVETYFEFRSLDPEEDGEWDRESDCSFVGDTMLFLLLLWMLLVLLLMLFMALLVLFNSWYLLGMIGALSVSKTRLFDGILMNVSFVSKALLWGRYLLVVSKAWLLDLPLFVWNCLWLANPLFVCLENSLSAIQLFVWLKNPLSAIPLLFVDGCCCCTFPNLFLPRFVSTLSWKEAGWRILSPSPRS